MDNSVFTMGGNGTGLMDPNAGGNINLFGNMTIIHTQQFQPRNLLLDQMAASMKLQSQMFQQQQMVMLEQQKLALEAKKLEVIDRLASQGGLPGNQGQTFKLANPMGDDLKLVGDDNEIVEFEVKEETYDDVEVSTPEVRSTGYCEVIDENKSETVEVEYEVKTSQIFYDFSPNADYIDLSKYFDSEGKILPTLKSEIEDASLQKIKIHCDYQGAPGVIFLKYDYETVSRHHLSWRYMLAGVLERYSKSVFKNPYITSKTEYVVFIMDKEYEFMNIIYIKPIDNLNNFMKFDMDKELENYRVAKEFNNWIEDNNALIENRRVKSVLLVAEPVIPQDKYSLELSPDHPLTILDFNSIYDVTKSFRIDMKEYAKKIKEVYNIHN